ncbi:MAG TPA: hypothetical protein DCP02_06200 [Actinobacteria bacterium]|nr:hypothetical protein [Actinomycetota bacterium]
MKAFKYIKGSSNEMIANRVFTADNFLQRLFGLLFKNPLNDGEALLIRGCTSIHTIGMRYNVDAVFIDERGTVLSTFKDIPPWRFTPYIRGARSVIEFSSGLLKEKSLNEGDKIIFVQ